MKQLFASILLLCSSFYSDARVRLELGIAAGPCFPVKKETLPSLYGVRETVNNASQAMVRTDVFNIKGNSALNGYVGAHVGGFQFFVTQDDGKTKQSYGVGYAIFAVALGAVYTVPLATDVKLRFRGGGGLGFGVSGFFEDVKPGLPLEIHAGIAYRRFLLSLGYMNFVAGRYSGYDYKTNTYRRGMFEVTNAYAVQGVVAELGIQFFKNKRR